MITTVNAVIGDDDVRHRAPHHDAGCGRRAALPGANARCRDEIAVLETTSHGLAQHRVTAVEFDVAVVTNITHEHLDFHGSYEAYRDAKAMLFRAPGAGSGAASKQPKTAVLNADDGSYSLPGATSRPSGTWSTPLGRMPSRCPASGVPVTELRARAVRQEPAGMSFDVR